MTDRSPVFTALILLALAVLPGCGSLESTAPSAPAALCPTLGSRPAPSMALYAFSRDKWWMLNGANSTWVEGGLLASSPLFQAAPRVAGQAPWEGEGLTAAWYRPDINLVSVSSKDRYWNLRSTDNVWTSWGLYADLPETHAWKQAPRVAGQRPWEGAGVTAGWYNPALGWVCIVSKDRYWNVRTSDNAWTACGEFAALPATHVWKQAPRVGGQYPWEGAGITAAWHNVSLGWLCVVSKDKYWNLRTADNVWTACGEFTSLPAAHAWKQAPRVGGQMPWEGPGITASVYQYPREVLYPPPPDPVLVGAGDFASSSTVGMCESTSRLVDQVFADNKPGAVFLAGDAAQEKGLPHEYNDYFNPTWGRHKARIRPAPGNHDFAYSAPGFQSGQGYFDYFGAAAGERFKGWYSYELGSWHVVVINSVFLDKNRYYSLALWKEQLQWLEQDLAAHPARGTVAYWHQPRFSTALTHGGNPNMQALWDILYRHGAEIVINGHNHVYERFAPQSPSGTLDQAKGIRQFVVGTGGRQLGGWLTGQGRLCEVRSNTANGVLKLTLRANSYDWEFIPVAGKDFRDSGTTLCH